LHACTQTHKNAQAQQPTNACPKKKDLELRNVKDSKSNTSFRKQFLGVDAVSLGKAGFATLCILAISSFPKTKCLFFSVSFNGKLESQLFKAAAFQGQLFQSQRTDFETFPFCFAQATSNDGKEL
jgi:hypothetical protein